MAIDIPSDAEEIEGGGNPAFSLLSIRRTIRKRWVGIAAAWVVLTACAVIVVRFLPAVYLAEAVVLIDSQKIPEKFVSSTVETDPEERIASIRQLLLSGGELKKIIDQFGLYREEAKMRSEEEILDVMRKDISVTLDPAGLNSTTGASSNSNRAKRAFAFRIGYQGADPVLVMRVANRLTDLYVEQNLKTREGQAAGTSDFLELQLRAAKKRLDEMEATVSAYKLSHNGELPQQEQSLSSTLSRLQTELEVNRDAINRAQQTRVILEGSLNAMEATMSAQARALEQQQRAAEEGSGDSVLVPDKAGPAQQKKMTLSDLQDQLAVLRAQFSENHPDVIALRAQLEAVKRIEDQRQAAKAEAAPVDPKPASGGTHAVAPLREPPEFARTREQVAALRAQIQGSDKELESRKAEQQRILHDLDSYQRRIERLPLREQEMAQITRDYEISKENYKSLLDKKMAAEMSLNMERGQQSERFIILDRAQIPERPIKPKRLQLYGAGAGGALVLALLLALAAELRRNLLLGEWELPAGTTVLARLPYIEVPAVPAKTTGPSRSWLRRSKRPADLSDAGAATDAVFARSDASPVSHV